MVTDERDDDDTTRQASDVEDLSPDDRWDTERRRAGRLIALPDDDDPSDRAGETQDVLAELAEDDGHGLSAEEDAVHIVEDESAAGITWNDDETPVDERRR